MIRAPLRPAWRRLWHVLLVMLGWVIYFGFWWKVLRGPTDVGPLFVVIPFIIVMVPAITLYWILHNLRLYRARDARRGSSIVADHYERDWHGRRVVADWDEVHRAREVVIRSEEGIKRYRVRVDGGAGS
ncbi:MAG: hypothetical protein B7Z66_07350 [Chromatiales bacterium 21-64-14]|nr:MAG: hypothetical protein B7Z66_07350 [Chromatiales bacterium 21-64-14]HQU15451.1 hypothetical protein [Gammaproteobacteria bacterium]